MGFLKVITSIAIAVLLLIFLNNLMAMIFPVSRSTSYYGNDEAYKKCESLQPNFLGDTNSDTNYYDSPEYKAAQDAYTKCTDDASRQANDKAAIQTQYVWLRAIVALLILIGISVFLFKKFPFYGGALIAGGLLFTVTYPIFAQTGFSLDFLYGGGDLSASVRTQTEIIKLITSLLGVSGLTLADVLFFEKHHEGNSLPTSNNFPQSQNMSNPNTPVNEIYPTPEDTKK
jgi:hypothetical protein